MRIREIFFHDFRSFRGPHRISFVDPLTDAVMPISVLAGTNGAGKTTILETIEALLALLLDSAKPRDLVLEARRSGFVALTVEFDPLEIGSGGNGVFAQESHVLHLAVGREDLMPPWFSAAPDSFGLLSGTGKNQLIWQPRNSTLSQRLGGSLSAMLHDQREIRGGLLYFPHNRRLGTAKSGRIEQPLDKAQWLFHFSASDRWQGSLEQLWVWQNYLDLEEGSERRTNLKPFVAAVEDILGPGRPITISKGRVAVLAAWPGTEGEPQQLALDQLPSGEQQVLLLFGELARRRRQGAVLAIDEPEISLHPTLQRQVVHQLRQFARAWDMQVILATHSLEVLRAVHESERILLDQLDQAESGEAAA